MENSARNGGKRFKGEKRNGKNRSESASCKCREMNWQKKKRGANHYSRD